MGRPAGAPLATATLSPADRVRRPLGSALDSGRQGSASGHAPRSSTSERTRAPGQDTIGVRWLCAPWVHASVPPCPGGGLPRHASPGGLVAGA